MGDNFEWPWQYNFPPFFTLQPNLDSRKKQLETWCSLVLSYYKNNKLYTLDVLEAQSSPLFHNKKIDRKLSNNVIEVILEELRKKGHVEWTDKSRQHCFLMWRTPQEWGKLIYQWVSNNGMTNTVCTFYELINGDDTTNEEFHDLDTAVFMRALKTLESQRQAEIIGGDGVKFF